MTDETVAVKQCDRQAAVEARRLLRKEVGDGENGVSLSWGGNPDIPAHAALAAIRAALASAREPIAGDAVEEAAKPWADYHGPLPDYDHPLRAVFESGVQYAVELLAKELGVDHFTPCDGTEEYDGDLGGTMMNIVLEAMPKDEHGDAIWPRDLPAALARPRPALDREAVAKAIASRTYAFPGVTDEGSDQYDCGEWEEMGCDAQATYLAAADQVLALATPPARLPGESTNP